MKSRDNILSRLRENLRDHPAEDRVDIPVSRYDSPLDKFKLTLQNIGGSVFEVSSIEDVRKYIGESFPFSEGIVTSLWATEIPIVIDNNPRGLRNVHVAILAGEFGVAENGAVWLEQNNMLDRALPIICENLVLVISQNEILSTLHDAYSRIAGSAYEFGTFIAGPSKTADIEQSLVLGAHGPKTLTVFIIKSDHI